MKAMKALNRSGTITIELSVIFPIFCMIALTFVFFMHGVVLEIGMGAAAREGARDYALNHDPVRAEARTQAVLNSFRVDRATVRLMTGGDEMRVVVDRPYGVYLPFIGEKRFELRRTAVFHADTLED